MMLSVAVFVAVLALTAQGEHHFAVRSDGRFCSRWTTRSAMLALRTVDDLYGCADNAAIERRGLRVRACCSTLLATRTEYGSDPSVGCGKQEYQPHRKRIVGGSEAVANSWPWQVFITFGDKICGGSLIAQSYVLTAAHCFFNPIEADKYRVYTGIHNVDEEAPPEGGIVPAEIIVHEDYNSETMINDIALIRLPQPVEITDKVRLICLPGPEATSIKQTVWVVGWGAVKEKGESSAVLKQVALHPMPGVCEKDPDFDKQKQICAGAHVAGQDSCQGDSGGPLMFESEETWYLNGIVSYGDGCAIKGSPAVYARVEYYLPWIYKKIGD